MKKLVFILVSFTLIFSLFALPSFAETLPEGSDAVDDTAESRENLSEIDLKGVYEEVVGLVTNAEIWGKIAVSVVGVCSIVIAISYNLSKITKTFNTVKDAIAGKASKEDAEKAVKEVGTDIKRSVEETRTELDEKYARLEEKNTKMVAVISLITLQLIKSPNARTEIMKIISDTKEISGDVVEFVEQIEENIKEADALEPKPDTPALDKIVAEQEEPKKDKPIMMLN